jgi:hypothetical protein
MAHHGKIGEPRLLREDIQLPSRQYEKARVGTFRPGGWLPSGLFLLVIALVPPLAAGLFWWPWWTIPVSASLARLPRRSP